MQIIINWTRKYPYPHLVFANAIKKIVNDFAKSKNIVLIDIPCGNGEVSYLLASNPHFSVSGYDISKTSIEYARNIYVKGNLRFEVFDIHAFFSLPRSCDVLCIVNSFFLLPEKEKLLSKIYSSIPDDSLMVLIIPNIDSRNYKNFIREYGAVNPLVFRVDGMISFLANNKFQFVAKQSIAYTYYYGRSFMKVFSVFAPLVYHFLNYFQTTFKIGAPSYYLLAFKKELHG